MPVRTLLRRFVHGLALLSVAACSEQCDDPTGPEIQATAIGRVTLDGEPVAGIGVRAGSSTGTTSEQGRYNLRPQGESDSPITGCVILDDPYGAVVDAASYEHCFTMVDGEVDEHDWAFVHVLPTVRITTPQDGARLEPGTGVSISYAATGSASINGEEGDDFFRRTTWISSLDGALGDGSLGFGPPVTLSEGTHVLTVTYVDLLDSTASDAITVVVGGGNQPPVATITSPSSGATYSVGEQIAFVGSGNDPEDGTLAGTSLTWSSQIDGQFGTGESFSSALSQGSHTVQLTVVDSDGASDDATITVDVTAAPGAGTIVGTVIYQGSALVDVPVTLSGSASRNTETDARGSYSFGGLPAGQYTITISPPPGTDMTTVQNVTLADGQSLTVNFSG